MEANLDPGKFPCGFGARSTGHLRTLKAGHLRTLQTNHPGTEKPGRDLRTLMLETRHLGFGWGGGGGQKRH